ncbi:Rieske 2Fe-2S domain-containing protein [Pseudomonas aeruginosa]
MSEYIETDDASYFRVRRQAYVSAELHRRELHEIFDDSWLYAAHLSELREPGDFITRDVGGRNLIIQRRADGEPAVYLNACAHRGARSAPSARATASVSPVPTMAGPTTATAA